MTLLRNDGTREASYSKAILSFPKKTIYLAGPITGLSYDEARHGWREEFAKKMPPHIFCKSPMRAKQFLKGKKNLSGDPVAYSSEALATAAGITTRDRFDLMTSDTVVMNVLGVKVGSIGTAQEVGCADAYRVPLVMFFYK
jgi:nucleoside 2-deoxyribosyltransferase